VLGQVCDIVDLDGPYHLANDAAASQIYSDGAIMVPASFCKAAQVPVITSLLPGTR